MKKQRFALAVTLATALIALLGLFWLVGSMRAGVSTPALAAPVQASDAPIVTAVDPVAAPNDLDTLLVITGNGFISVPTVSLGSTILEDVDWVSAEQLTATIPWGLNPGDYAVTVINPGGESGSLPDAVSITPGIGVWATGGPYGGSVRQVIVKPGTPTTAYAVVFAVGVFATYNSGEHWEPMLTLDYPSRLVFDAHDPDIMYSGGSGLQQDNMRSMDGGQTWELYFDEFYPQYGGYVSFPAPHPTISGTIYLATGGDANTPILPGEGGVYYSEDYGESWVTRTSGLTDTHLVDITFHPSDPEMMAVASASGNIFTTSNGGLTWNWAAGLDQELRRIYFNPFGVHEAWIVPFAENQPPSSPYLYKSTDSDLSTWNTSVVTDELVYSGGIWSMAFLSGTVWAAGDRGYVSDDGGENWSPVIGGEDPFSKEIFSFDFPQGNDQTIYVGTEMNGFVQSTDGGDTWQESNEGLGGLQVRGVTVPRSQIDTVYANTFERGILRSDDGGRAWLELIFFHGGSPKGQVLAADPFAPERVYYGTSCENNPCMQVSSDRGGAWHEVTMTLPITWTGWEGTVLTTAPHPGVPGRILAGAGFCQDTAHCNSGDEPSGIYASDDYGESWSFLGPSPAISEVLSIAFDTSDTDLIYAGTRSMGLWRSIDGGDSWAPLPIPGVLPPVDIASIAPHPDIAGTVYVRLYSYANRPNPQPNLFVSQDGGLTWAELPDVDTVFGGIGGRGLVFSPPAPDSGPYTLYSGCEVGLCRSRDGANTWEQVAGAPRPSSNSLFNTALVANSDSQRTRLYLGTPGGVVTTEGSAATTGAAIIESSALEYSVLGGGVYRLTSILYTDHVYMPLVER